MHSRSPLPTPKVSGTVDTLQYLRLAEHQEPSEGRRLPFLADLCINKLAPTPYFEIKAAYNSRYTLSLKKIGPLKKRYCNDFSVDEMVDWVEMEVETESVEVRISTTDKGKEKVNEDATEFYKSVDYLSPGEEELIELRNMMKANRKAKAKAKDNQDLGMNEPNAENSMPTNNVRGETFEEHDIYMNELLKSLKTADKDGLTEDPFIFVEKHVERYPMYDETTHWRLRKPKFKEYLTYYALENGFSLWYERSEEVRVVVKCGQRPPRLSDPEKGKQRKQTKYHSVSSDDLPTCHWRCYARWMNAEKTFQCISLADEHTCFRNFNFGAFVNYKWIAKIFGDKIRANPDIRLCDIADLVMKKYKCKVSPTQCTNAKKYALTKFYVCFVGLADGWKARCMKIIALDGCLLKSPNQGEKLTSIGRDENNHIYPVAWAVGLIEPVKDVMLNAEHRQCARHIYENFRKQYPGLEFRQLLWSASKASYPQLFNKIMDKIKSANPNAHKYLIDKNPKTWSKAFFEVDKGWKAIDNGFSECFNSVSVNVRHKPLLTMLEAIRVLVLERMNKMREISRKWNPGVCPNIKKRLEWLKKQQRVPESDVPAWFEIDMYFVAYNNYVKPGMNFWPDQSMYSTVLPPKPRKMPSRPKKKRVRAIGEGGSLTRISKLGSQGSCSNCKKPGHNKSSCKEPVVKQTPKPKGVPGRPKKNQSVDDSDDVDVVLKGQIRDEGASGSRGGATGSRGRGGAAMSRGGASGSRGGASVSRGVVGGSRGGSSVSCGASGSRGRGAGGSGDASGSRGRGADGSGDASGSRGRGGGGSKRKMCHLLEHKKDKVRRRLGLLALLNDEDQVEQIEDQAEIELTQLEQTQEQTQDQVQPQEQPQQAASRMPSASILQRKLGKQDNSQNTALNVE
ncbi:hypothetical protein Tco_0725551 [Tanacetum coccineum]|uniref:Transposase, MuDR, MULE transposase domain protein n=1 Tax=Tanacetum coccineum TaxID=301880 RepID=A0ABQ4YFD3_9ASTR